MLSAYVKAGIKVGGVEVLGYEVEVTDKDGDGKPEITGDIRGPFGLHLRLPKVEVDTVGPIIAAIRDLGGLVRGLVPK